MSIEAARRSEFPAAGSIARQFVDARLKSVALADYPGPLPPDLASGYECQELAIDLWPDQIGGWKIGRVPPQVEKLVGAQRLAGPMFRQDVQWAATGTVVEFGVFIGGFAAVEAEYVFEIAHDAPVGKLTWSLEEADALVGRMLVGIETAGSPLATINALGPTVVVSDFGNNAGMIIGPEVPDWRKRELKNLTCETFTGGVSVGRGSAANILGGPLESLRFVAELCAQRGRPLKAGMLITTGAATGIHDIVAGQGAYVDFKGIGRIRCTAKPRAPRMSAAAVAPAALFGKR